MTRVPRPGSSTLTFDSGLKLSVRGTLISPPTPRMGLCFSLRPRGGPGGWAFHHSFPASLSASSIASCAAVAPTMADRISRVTSGSHGPALFSKPVYCYATDGRTRSECFGVAFLARSIWNSSSQSRLSWLCASLLKRLSPPSCPCDSASLVSVSS